MGKYNKSLNIKLMLSLVIAIMVLLSYMELASFYSISIYKKRTFENYQNSLEMYTSFWENRLNMINQELITISEKSHEPYYWNMCFSNDDVEFETSKIMMQKSMIEISRLHEYKIMVFTYIPDRKCYIRSSDLVNQAKDLKGLDEGIRDYIILEDRKPSLSWNYVYIGGRHYFIQYFAVNNGYIGTVVPCDVILNSLTQDTKQLDYVAFVNGEEVISQIGDPVEQGKSFSSFRIATAYMPYSIQVHVRDSKIYSDYKILLLIAVSVAVMSIIVIIVNLQIERKMVLTPLKKLKDAMEQFSRGKLDVRLKEDTNSEEISSVNRAFNSMAEQIMGLKIEIYELELRRQKIQGSFLRVQIQPHFYCNILNLIYGLAGMKEFETVQKLSKVTSNYFRYLLSTKDALVPLSREEKCVMDYGEIQQMRYPGMLELELESMVEEKEILVPPLIIQTFVENSINHNITLVPVLHVRVRLWRRGEDYLLIEVEDNGLGFPNKVLEQINSNRKIIRSGNHIGITNVKERLKLIYGEDASFSIESSKGRTRIRIQIPYQRSLLDGRD